MTSRRPHRYLTTPAAASAAPPATRSYYGRLDALPGNRAPAVRRALEHGEPTAVSRLIDALKSGSPELVDLAVDGCLGPTVGLGFRSTASRP